MTSYEMAVGLAKALDSKKGLNIKVLKTQELTTLADYFVLCTATSTTQVKAMSDACEDLERLWADAQEVDLSEILVKE